MLATLHDELRRLELDHIADTEYGDVHRPRFEEDLASLKSILKPGSQVLEIAPYVGWLSIALTKLGHTVSTVQPAHHQDQLQKRFDHYGITTKIARFPHDPLPYPAGSFDLVIFCETLEHFAFNPVPVLRQMLECLKPGGQLYVTTPNQAHLKNALKLLAGKTINDSSASFFPNQDCYDAQGHLEYGLHWREYSMDDLALLLERTGFEVHSRRYRVYRSNPKEQTSLVHRAGKAAYRLLYRLRPALAGSMLEVMATKPRRAA